jgi:hypothetical protein
MERTIYGNVLGLTPGSGYLALRLPMAVSILRFDC